MHGRREERKYMAVFVDGMTCGYGRMIMCHMAADTTEELLAMADKIGVQRKWLQHPGTWREHFDICKAKRALAVKFGAIEVSQREFVLRKQPELQASLEAIRQITLREHLTQG